MTTQAKDVEVKRNHIQQFDPCLWAPRTVPVRALFRLGLLGVCLLMATAGVAGEARPRPAGGEEEAEAEAPKTLYEMQQFQSFTYVSGGRDPLTFRVRPEGAAQETAADDRTNFRTTGPVVDPKEKRKLLREALARVEPLLLAHDYKSAIKVCVEARSKIASTWGGEGRIDQDPDVNRLYRRALAYERTAKRLQQAVEIKEEFDDLRLQIDGIRWTPTGASALINGTIYEAGGVIQEKGVATQVQIETIEENGVVFIYKGQRFRKTIGTGVTAESR